MQHIYKNHLTKWKKKPNKHIKSNCTRSMENGLKMDTNQFYVKKKKTHWKQLTVTHQYLVIILFEWSKTNWWIKNKTICEIKIKFKKWINSHMQNNGRYTYANKKQNENLINGKIKMNNMFV